MKNTFFFLILTTLIWSNISAQKTNTTPAQPTDFVITIKTSFGDMVAVLYDETPKHKQNFLKLAREHFYDSLLFHRVIDGFMIQGGDPASKKSKAGEPLGNGSPGYTVDAEFNPKLYHKRGALAAARIGGPQNPQKASSGSQFYIVHGTVTPEAMINSMKYDQGKLNTAMREYMSKPENKALSDTLKNLYTSGQMEKFNTRVLDLVPTVEKATGIKIIKDISPEKVKAYTTIGGTPFLDDDYTVFGEVIKGLDVIEKITKVQKNPSDRPLEDVRMFISVVELPKQKITQEYGYVYPETAPKK
ncbi:peptidyl-prolyl cis-trans isomerase [Cytophagales bacterium WSM2-2]|nr:peptidyl-prolyl cis-trans isomerase [Cytophagales bacterium WSM2-2]